MKKFKVIEVNSWRDIPSPTKSSSLTGYSQPETGTIYVVKGKVSPGVIEHERFHSIMNHPVENKNFKDYIDHELEAYEYAWLKVKSPRRILSKLRGMYNSCLPWMRSGELTPKKLVSYMKEKLNSLDVSETWKNDMLIVEKESRRAEGW